MTPFEKYFVEVMQWYEDNEVPVMIHGSTLLNIVRNQNVGPRKDLKTDKEINLMCFAEDMTSDKEWLLRQASGYFKPIKSNMSDSTGIFYGKENKKHETDTHWELEPGLVFLTKLWKCKTLRYKCHGGDDCIIIPNEFVAEKAKWTDIHLYDHDYKAPTHIGAYLEYYYGDWWVEKKDWHWTGSPHLVKYQKLVKDGEICLE